MTIPTARCILTLVLAALAAPAFAQAPAPAAFRAELPVLDVPYNTAHGLRAPSMEQSLALSTAFYEGSHSLIEGIFGTGTFKARAATTLWDAFDLIVLPLPGGGAWLHEEYHRAVMGHRGIHSFNDVYRFNAGADAIYVSRVRDEDLVALKARHPAEQVRLSMAGLEGEYQLVRRLEQNEFSRRSRTWNTSLYWIQKLGSIGYVMSGTWSDQDQETDDSNAKDGADIRRRDFTGHDFTAWVYDLHRPDEAYAARGVHPSGVGIDRYIKRADLTPDELAYLRKQGRLQWLNLADPFLLGVRGVEVKNPLNGRRMTFNANLGHTLTPFGHTIDGNLFFRQDGRSVFVTMHNYSNGERWFPGLRAEVADLPFTLGRHALTISPRAAVWLQPDGLRFHSRGSSPGAMGGARLHGSIRGAFGAFVDVEAKTAGWAAGTVSLGRDVSVRAGLSVEVR